MNAANVDLGNLMLRLNAQAMEIIRLRQLQESSVVRDPWLIAVINLVHEHHTLGYGGTDVTISHFWTADGSGCHRFHADHDEWVPLEDMMATIPKLCAMGLHILVLEPGCLSCPFTIHWETPGDFPVNSDTEWETLPGETEFLDKTRLRWPDMVYHPPTGPCTMFDAPGFE